MRAQLTDSRRYICDAITDQDTLQIDSRQLLGLRNLVLVVNVAGKSGQVTTLDLPFGNFHMMYNVQNSRHTIRQTNEGDVQRIP